MKQFNNICEDNLNIVLTIRCQYNSLQDKKENIDNVNKTLNELFNNLNQWIRINNLLEKNL